MFTLLIMRTFPEVPALVPSMYGEHLMQQYRQTLDQDDVHKCMNSIVGTRPFAFVQSTESGAVTNWPRNAREPFIV